MNPINKLNQLSADLDTILFRNMEDENADKKRRGLPVGTIAATGAAAYGASKLRQRYGADQVQGVGNQVKATVSGIKREAGEMAGEYAGRAKTYAGKVGNELKKSKGYWKSARAGGKDLGQSVGGAIKTVARRTMRGIASHGFEAELAHRIVALDAMLDQVNELRAKRSEDDGWVASDHLIAPRFVKRKSFDDLSKDDEFGYHPEKARRNVKIAAALGLVGAGVAGAKIDRLAKSKGVYDKIAKMTKSGIKLPPK